jgi:Ca2+-binding RTX toxin-like protein
VALVFNGGADGAIIFNDFPGPKAGDQAIEFVMADNTTVISYSTATLVDMAGKPGALRFGAASSTKGPDRDPTPSNGSGPSNPYGTPGDVVRGTDADNQLYVYDRAVTLVGEAGNDQLFGVNFGETFFGDAGDDIVYTNEGDDRAVGGSGNDKLYGAGGQDFIFGDDVDVSGYGLEFGTVLGNVPVRPAPEQALPTPTGDLLVTGEPTGPSEPVAGEPQPTLTVELFAVADIPSSEWDAYTFSEPADASEPAPAGYQISSAKGAVTIADFTSGVDDIYLFVGAFKKLGSASEDGTPLKKGCFVVNTTGLATKAGAQIIYEKDTGELYYDVDGKGGRKATHFATLEDCPNVSIHDFVLCL